MWSLANITAPDGTTAVGVVTADGTARRHPALAAYATVADVLSDWPNASSNLRDIDPSDGDPVDAERLSAPLPTPGKLICVGANYHSHLAEMLGFDAVPAGFEPFMFLLPTTSIIGSGDTIRIPEDPSARVDWEAELGVVIGSTVRNVSVDDALDAVAGYTVVNDVSARGYHKRPDPLAPPFAFDWLRSKGADTFSPIGPTVTPSWFVPDPQDLPIRLWRNGNLEQDGNTGDMIFGVAQLVAAASATMTLNPGDVIATGTPAGVGNGKGLSLTDGDEVTVEISGLGTLSNPVAFATAPVGAAQKG